MTALLVLVAAVSAQVKTARPRLWLTRPRLALMKRLLAGGDAELIAYKKVVDSALAGRKPYGFGARDAALFYVLTGDRRYAELAIKSADGVVERGVKHARRDSYLHSGPLVADVASVYDWCRPLLGRERRERYVEYMDQVVYNIWHHKKAKWSGWATRDPGNNYFYSFLTATLLNGLATHGDNPKAKEHVEHFRRLFDELCLPYFKKLEGGGSREGTAYGLSVRVLFSLLDAWNSGTGEDLLGRFDFARDCSLYMIHSTVPTLERVYLAGDHARESTGVLCDYHRGYMAVLADAYGREDAGKLARGWLRGAFAPAARWTHAHFFAALHRDPAAQALPAAKLSPAYHAVGTGTFFVRSGWEKGAAYVVFQSGRFEQSHQHEDQNSFMIFRGEWLATDANYFSHSGILQEISVHNTVRIDGAERARQFRGPGGEIVALEHTDEYSYVCGEAAAAYNHKRYGTAASVVRRELLFVPPGLVVVFDVVVPAKPEYQAVWLLNVPRKPALEGKLARVAGVKSEMLVETVLPAKAEVSVLSYKEYYPRKKEFPRGDPHRIEVRGGKGQAFFLHVLAVGEKGRLKRPKVKLVGRSPVKLRVEHAGREFEVSFSTASPRARLRLIKGWPKRRERTMPREVKPIPLFVR